MSIHERSATRARSLASKITRRRSHEPRAWLVLVQGAAIKLGRVRLAVACAVAAVVLFGLAFAIGALSGWQYGSRHRVCAVVKQGSVTVPVCDYDYRPPSDFVVR